MDSRKIRTYPPIIVSLIAAAVFFAAAVGQISESAERRAEIHAAEIQDRPKEVQATAPMSLEITLPAEETGDESLIASRDWDAEESYMLMKIAMAEAEGESVEGKALVMLVVLNRVWSDGFPNTIEEVIFEPGQFSPVVEGGRYYTTEPDSECREALELVMKGGTKATGHCTLRAAKTVVGIARTLNFFFRWETTSFTGRRQQT